MSGLTTQEAVRRLAEAGPNELREDPGPSPASILAAQGRNPMVALLLVASVLAAAVGEGTDAIAIGTIVLLNAVVGFVQEFRAEKALRALRSMTGPRARVVRDGQSVMVAAREVVPGDVLVLEAGDLVAADARLLEAHYLRTNEAALTGESLPVSKSLDGTGAHAPLAERRDRVFLGTSVATGTGRAEVVATGMRTEMGRIATLLATAESGPTPLQKQLAGVSKALLVVCLGVVLLVAILGLLRGRTALEVLMASVSLAVAAVPEGLPAIVTIALAVGVQRMAARHVLIRKLPAVEALGSVTVVCTDKTGTLTTGVMSVREIFGPVGRVLGIAAGCCDAELHADGTGVGDPTELAILRRAAEEGIVRDAIERTNPRRRTEPFDPATKRMVVERSDGALYVKGAPETILSSCRTVAAGAPDDATRMSRGGLRVLAVATGSDEAHLHLVGLLGLADPPRPEAIVAIAQARRAGIRTVMITGDHPVTARAIAHELGVWAPPEDPTELVHARATPEDKIAIVRASKERGDIVAMTGDGVNDAPAIREAHVGIAMGKGGTEVTREAAAIVLTDDNFASIIEGVREGRTIYENIQKTICYLLTGNAAELLLMLAAAAAGLPLPLLPLHLLWVNLVTDGFPALALVMDPPDADVLERPPRAPSDPMLGRTQWTWIGVTAVLEASIVLGVFVWYLDDGLALARTMAFSTLVFSELTRSFAARSPDRVLFEVGAFSNLVLLAVVILSGSFQIALHHVGWVQRVFQVAPLSLAQWAVAIGFGLVPVTVLEMRKLVKRWVR